MKENEDNSNSRKMIKFPIPTTNSVSAAVGFNGIIEVECGTGCDVNADFRLINDSIILNDKIHTNSSEICDHSNDILMTRTTNQSISSDCDITNRELNEKSK